MTQRVGHARIVNLSTKEALSFFSVSTDAQTNLAASGASAGSPNTDAFMARQVWHHGAQASTNSGTCALFALPSAAA